MKVLTIAILTVACVRVVGAQEVDSINLTNVLQRATLRYPPPPPGATGGYGGVSISDCGANPRDPHALGVSLLHVLASEVDPAEPFEVEFKIANTGKVPIDLPVSPHLSNLQPADPSQIFSYFNITLVASVVHDPGSRGLVELYGSIDHKGTMLTLEPSQWIRVTANVKIDPPPTSNSSFLEAGFWLRENTYYPHAGGSSSNLENVCPNVTPTPAIKVYWFHPGGAPDSRGLDQ